GRSSRCTTRTCARPSDMDTTEHQGHESSDANIRGVVWAAIGLALMAVLVQVGLYFQLRLLATRADRAEPVAPAFAPTSEHGPPPADGARRGSAPAARRGGEATHDVRLGRPEGWGRARADRAGEGARGGGGPMNVRGAGAEGVSPRRVLKPGAQQVRTVARSV